MLDFRVQEKPALTFEGETKLLLRALATKQPVLQITTGGGMGGADSAGLAPAIEALGLTTVFSGNSVSVGVANQLLAAYGRAVDLTHCYHSVFCSTRFIRPGARAYIDGKKMSMSYFGAALRLKLNGAVPAHPDSSIRVGLTNYETGKPVTVAPDLCDVRKLVRYTMASAIIPSLCGGMDFVTIDGVPLCDGGIAQPLPLDNALAQNPKYLLILMSSQESASHSWFNQWIEYQFAHRRMTQLPQATKEALLARHSVFCDTLHLIREQLILPLGHADRYLPPTAIVWPTANYGLSMVEQNPARVQRSLGAVYAHWWKLLREEKMKCAA